MSRARQREGERREGYEVYQLIIAALGRGVRPLKGPEHCDGQDDGHGEGVRGNLSYLRIRRGVSGAPDKGKLRLPLSAFLAK